MRRLRAIGLNALAVVASIAFTLTLLEVALRFMPVAWAPPVQPPTAADPIQRYAPNAPFTWSVGWNFATVVRGRTNAQGFVADYDYDAAARTPLIAVLGDSYVEALMVPFAETVTGRLQAAMGQRGRAYAIAQAGSPLSQYVAYARHACAVYAPERIAVVIVGNDFSESVYADRARDGIHHLHPRLDGGFDYSLTPNPPLGIGERIARNSALALYLARNVKVSSLLALWRVSQAQAAPNAYVGNTASDASEARVGEGRRVVDWFLREMASACRAPRDIVLLVDAPRPNIYDLRALAETRASYFGIIRQDLIEKASAAGFKVVDMEPWFRERYAKDQRVFEVPGDGHWNAQGHAVAADALRAALSDWIPAGPTSR